MGYRRTVATLVAAGALLEFVLMRRGRTAGSTRAERAMPLPGDDVVIEPQVVTDHATTIDAPAECVWPWLVQMGWGRAGWYTARVVDRVLFPANGASADRIEERWQGLRVGDLVPDGPPGAECGFDVVVLDPPRALVLRSTSHLPLSWRAHASLEWTWSFRLESLGERGTRFHCRSRWRTAPWWLTLVGRLGVVPADYFMSRSMLRGVATRAERLARTGVARGPGAQERSAFGSGRGP